MYKPGKRGWKCGGYGDSISLYCPVLYLELQHHIGTTEFLPHAVGSWQGHLMRRLQLKCFKISLPPVLGYHKWRGCKRHTHLQWGQKPFRTERRCLLGPAVMRSALPARAPRALCVHSAVSVVQCWHSEMRLTDPLGAVLIEMCCFDFLGGFVQSSLTW